MMTNQTTVGHSEIPKTLHELADELTAHFAGVPARPVAEIRYDIIEAMARRNQEMRPASPALAAELIKRNARPTV